MDTMTTDEFLAAFDGLPEDDAEAYLLSDIICLSGTMLTRKGTHWYGLCPFHKESKASFRVTDETDAYLCFGCGARGTGLTFNFELAAAKARYPDGVMPTRAALYGPSMKMLKAENRRLRQQGRVMIHAMEEAATRLDNGATRDSVAALLRLAIPLRAG